MAQTRVAWLADVAVEYGLRSGDRAFLAWLGMEPAGQPVCLVCVEHAELPQHRDGPGRDLARPRVAVLLLQRLPEGHEGGLLALADLAASLLDLPARAE